MSDSDVLERAARALRAAHTGEREGSGFTRARIMGTLHRERRGRWLRWAIVSPLVSVLLVGSAWAQSAGKWPVVWGAVTSVFVPQASKPNAGPRSPELRQARPELPALQPPSMSVPEPPQVPVVEAPSMPAPVPPSAVPRPVTLRAGKQPSVARGVTSSSQDPAPELPQTRGAGSEPAPSSSVGALAADPELTSFRSAHDLHFQAGRPRQAIAAYAAYLKAYPNGRFVPEASYNTALNWIKLGDKAAARQALRPFASGTYGEYRRSEAQQLLEALR